MTRLHFPGEEKILPGLVEVRICSTDGDVHVITRYRDATQNPRTTFKKIIKRAGLVPWPKPFQNLWASRSTELEDQFATHVAAKWLGHSPQVARQHYHMVHDEHFERATKVGETTRNPTRAALVGDGIASYEGEGAEEAGSQKPLKNKGIRGNTPESAKKKLGDAEPQSAPRRTRRSGCSGEKTALFEGGSARVAVEGLFEGLGDDPDFVLLAETWKHLTPADRMQGVLY